MSTKNDIYSNLKIELESITHDNGYESDIGLVRLGPLFPNVEYAKLPAIGISGNDKELLVPGTTNNRYSTAITLFILVRDNDDIEKNLSAVLSDIETLIYDNIENNLGDNTFKLFYVSTSDEAIEQGGYGSARMNLELIWWDIR